jgi:hypothetical protein
VNCLRHSFKDEKGHHHLLFHEAMYNKGDLHSEPHSHLPICNLSDLQIGHNNPCQVEAGKSLLYYSRGMVRAFGNFCAVPHLQARGLNRTAFAKISYQLVPCSY